MVPPQLRFCAGASSPIRTARSAIASAGYRLNWIDGVIDYASSFAQVDSLRPALPISGTFTTDAADKNQGRFRAPISMQPPRKPAPAAPPEPPAAAPPEPEAPAPTGSRLVSVDEFFGYSARRGKTA